MEMTVLVLEILIQLRNMIGTAIISVVDAIGFQSILTLEDTTYNVTGLVAGIIADWGAGSLLNISSVLCKPCSLIMSIINLIVSK